MIAQWDTLTYADGKVIKARMFAGSSEGLPRFFASARFWGEAEAFYIEPRIGQLGVGAYAGKFSPEKANRVQADAMLFAFNLKQLTNGALGLDHVGASVYYVQVSDIIKTFHIGLHGGIAKKTYGEDLRVPVLKNQTKYELSDFSAVENSFGLGMVFRKGIICGILTESSTLDNAAIKEYRYRLLMVRVTADLLYYNGFKYVEKRVAGPPTDPVQASDLTFSRKGWRLMATGYWRSAGRTISGQHYFGASMELGFEHVLYGKFNESGVYFVWGLGVTYGFKQSFRTVNRRLHVLPSIGKAKRSGIFG